MRRVSDTGRSLTSSHRAPLPDGRYDHLPEVRAARRGLVAQHKALMLSVWRRHAHICENYSPARTTARDGDDCTGMNFYHWGALTGFIGLLEAEDGRRAAGLQPHA